MAAILSIDNVNDLLKNCLLPGLLNDLDSIPIEAEHFTSYHEHLAIELPILYDWVQHQGQWLHSPEMSSEENTELQVNFIILLCELSNPDAIYATPKTELIENAQRLLNKYDILSTEVERKLFQYYENQLSKDKWKRNLGAVHGFFKYLKHRYESSKKLMEKSVVLLSLSVGLNVKSCHEYEYKRLGMKMFDVILNRTNSDNIQSMNIHQVIYEAVIKDIYILDSQEFVKDVLNILLRCLDFYPDINSLEWSYLDDILETIIRNVTLTSDPVISICLLKYLNKFLIYFNINRHEFFDKLNDDLSDADKVIGLRLLSERNNSYNNYRWAKAILQMFVLGSHKLLLTPISSTEMLMELHKCYMIGLLPIDLPIIEPHLITFFDKFIVLLMQTAQYHREQEFLIKSITYILDTFYFQLLKCPEKSKLFTYKKAFQKLLQHEPFKGHSTIGPVITKTVTKEETCS